MHSKNTRCESYLLDKLCSKMDANMNNVSKDIDRFNTMPDSKADPQQRRRNRDSRAKTGKVVKRKRKDTVNNKATASPSISLLQMTVDHVVREVHEVKHENGENRAPVDVPDGMPLPINMEAFPPLQSPVRAGFQDCTLETIKYLTLVEQMPEDHPVILGLRRHLLIEQSRLDDSRIVDEGETRAHEVQTCSFFTNNIHPSAQTSREPVPNRAPQNFNENLNLNSNRQLKSELDIADMLPSLALLGQCNPAIGRITNELNDLLKNIVETDSD